MYVYVGYGGYRYKSDFISKHPDQIGWCYTPNNYKSSQDRYFLDNGAWSAFNNDLTWNSDDFISAVYRLTKPENKQPDFIVAPDIVGFGRESLKRSIKWINFRPDIPWYLAIQNGMTINMVNKDIMDKIQGLFIGGTPEWKEKNSKIWCDHAHNFNKKCHIGRIGTIKKVLWAENIIGCDSIDSSNFARHKKNWDELMMYFIDKHPQITLDKIEILI